MNTIDFKTFDNIKNLFVLLQNVHEYDEKERDLSILKTSINHYLEKSNNNPKSQEYNILEELNRICYDLLISDNTLLNTLLIHNTKDNINSFYKLQIYVIIRFLTKIAEDCKPVLETLIDNYNDKIDNLNRLFKSLNTRSNVRIIGFDKSIFNTTTYEDISNDTNDKTINKAKLDTIKESWEELLKILPKGISIMYDQTFNKYDPIKSTSTVSDTKYGGEIINDIILTETLDLYVYLFNILRYIILCIKYYLSNSILMKLKSLSVYDISKLIDMLKNKPTINLESIPDPKRDGYYKSILLLLFYDISFIDKLHNQNVKQNILSIISQHDIDNYTKMLGNQTLFDRKKKFIYLQKFITYFENNILFSNTDLETSFNLFKKNINSTENINKYIIIDFLNQIKNRYSDIENIVIFLKTTDLDANLDFRNSLNSKIQEKSNNTIITFIKMRGDINNYNQRFKIHIANKSNDSLYINYNDHNIKYYDKSDDKWVISNDLNQKKNEYKVTVSVDQSFDMNQYNYNYVFGNFTKIFLPNISNKIISEDESIKKSIIFNLLNNKPVFILGYGASGAGKTSSLIYFKGVTQNNSIKYVLDKQPENGIILYLCNLMASNHDYIKIIIKTKEFYYKTENLSDSSINESGELIFTYDKTSNTFILDNPYTHIVKHLYRNTDAIISPHEIKVLTADGQYDTTRDTLNINKNASLGLILRYLIDIDRFVKATTNNPNSSRSHVLLFITFLKDQDTNGPTLIVGDFAGVENRFACNQTDLHRFSTIKRDNSNEYYYNDELDDPIGNKQQGGAPALTEMPLNFKAHLFDLFPWETPIFYRTINGLEIKNANEVLIIPEYDNYNFMSLKQILTNDSNLKLFINLIKNLKTFDENINNNELKDLIISSQYIKTIEEQITLEIDDYYKQAISKYSKEKMNTESYDLRKAENIKKRKSQGVDRITQHNEILQNIKAKLTNTQIKDVDIETYIKENIKDARANLIIKSLIKEVQIVEGGYYRTRQEIFDETHNTIRTYTTKVSTRVNTIKDHDILYPITIPEFTEEIPRTSVQIQSDLDNITSLKTRLTTILSNKTIFSIDKEDRDIQNIISNIFKKSNNTNEKYTMYYKIIYNTLCYPEIINDTIYCNIYTIYYIINKVVASTVFNSLKLTTMQFNDLLQTINNKINKINEVEIKKNEQLQKICDNRVNEGKYINNSLKLVRQIINKIIYYRNIDLIDVLPNYIDDCLVHYCPNKKDCFVDKSTYIEEKEIASIFDNIKHYPYLDMDKLSDTDFYKQILVCVFCVFNIDKSANNPPPIPYIDINELKKYIINNSNNLDATGIKKQIDPIISKINIDFSDKTIALKESIEYKNFFTKYYTTISTLVQNDLIKMTDMFIEVIDNNNAASAIGTLEYIDQVSKYNKTNIICNISKIDKTIYTDIKDIKKTTSRQKYLKYKNKYLSLKM